MTSAFYLFLGIVLCYFAYSCLGAFISPLRDVPGPLLARFTRLWELWMVLQGDSQERLVQLHHRYGTIMTTILRRPGAGSPEHSADKSW